MTPTSHQIELRRQLLEAARGRQHETLTRAVGFRRARHVAPLVVAGIVGVALLAARVISEAGPAEADTFTFSILGDELVITVIGVVDDPAAAAAELEQRGFDVRIKAVPAAPRYEGKVISASSDDASVRVDTSEGVVDAIRMPVGQQASLTINYGREASEGERYQATGSVMDCSAYAAQTVSPLLQRKLAERYGPTIRWQQVSGAGITDIRTEELGEEAMIVDIVPLSDSTVMVIVTDGKIAPPTGMGC